MNEFLKHHPKEEIGHFFKYKLEMGDKWCKIALAKKRQEFKKGGRTRQLRLSMAHSLKEILYHSTENDWKERLRLAKEKLESNALGKAIGPESCIPDNHPHFEYKYLLPTAVKLTPYDEIARRKAINFSRGR